MGKGGDTFISDSSAQLETGIKRKIQPAAVSIYFEITVFQIRLSFIVI